MLQAQRRKEQQQTAREAAAPHALQLGAGRNCQPILESV